LGHPERIKVLYITAHYRSGSTILNQVLGEVPGVMAVGELVASVWTYGFAQNLSCGCGRPFRECPFWSGVVREAFGGFEAIDAKALVTLWRQVPRFHLIPFVLAACRSEKNCPNSKLSFAHKWGATLRFRHENRPKWGFSQHGRVSPTGC